MNPMQKAPTSLRDIDFGYYFRHYLGLFWRWKWYIVIAGPLVTAAWIVYVFKFNSITPALDATAILGVENPSNMSAVQDFQSPQNQRAPALEKAELLKSRSFLASIVEKLSLRLVVSKESRRAVFDSVRVDSAAAMGKYVFVVNDDKETWGIHYWNSQFGYVDRVVLSGNLVTLDVLVLPGVYLKFSNAFLKNPRTVTFHIVRARDAIGAILGKMKITTGQEGSTQISITLSGKDYPLIAQTVNVLVDEFVQKNLGFRKRKTNEVIGLLEKQLATAAGQLAVSESMLRNFRERYPTVGLPQDAEQTITSLSQLESGNFSSQNDLSDGERLRRQFKTAGEDEREQAANEVLLFLASRNMIAATAMQTDYRQLVQNHNAALQSYAKGHPVVLDIEKKKKTLTDRIETLLNEYLQSAQSTMSMKAGKIGELSQRIQQLPSQELRLAELTRQQQISSQIHSVVLSRFNQAKISDAVEVADVFVIDYAVVPEAPPDFVNVLVLMAIGIGLGLGVGFLPPIGMDLIDKTARTPVDLQRLIGFPLLEAIPCIKDKKKRSRPHRKKKNKKDRTEPAVRAIEPTLITADYAPNFINELFRSLRAKIMLRLQSAPHKWLAITSHSVGEGKSMIASNIAITTAQQKLRTVLIDGDIRKGVLHNNFVLQKKPGLSDLLFTEDQITEAFVAPFCQQTHVPNLSLISSGPNVPNPTELLSSPRMKALIDLLSRTYEVIIMDTPPIGIVSDAFLVQNVFASYVIVIEAGSTNVVDLRKKIAEYPDFSKKIIGTVLNKVAFDKRLKRYKYSHYSY
jgi:succinoglycan biosynthesis transport protein ExoP